MVNGAVWNGREAFIAGDLTASVPQVVRPILLSFTPASHRLRRIDLARSPVDASERPRLRPVAWTGTEVLFTAGASTPVRYDPKTGRWRRAKHAPCSAVSQVAWIGDRLASACGKDRLELYSPRTNTWQTIPTRPSLLNTREGSAIAWTGHQLIVWSGTAHATHNPTPPDGSSIRLK